MVACIPESTDWECEHTDVGDCLRDYSAACWSRSGGRAGLGKGTTAGKAKGEDGCRSSRREGGRKERALAVGGYCTVFGFDWQLEDIPISDLQDRIMFLTNIDAVIFHGFRSILQHEVRYPLAEALDSVLAFFLTLSDHGREDR